MKTVHKIALARAAYLAVHGVRSIGGLGDNVVVTRRGIRYALDLRQGIDFSIYLQGHFEPAAAAAYERQITEGSLILDVGANIGAHTLNLSRVVGERGRVIAIEPTGYAFSKLKQNLAINPNLAQRVTAIQCFLAARDGDAAPDFVYSSWPLVGGKSLHPKHLGEPSATATVPTRSIDSLLAEYAPGRRVSFVKMDVDGHECDVLAGAKAMMDRDRPTFIMELAPYALTECGGSLGRLLGEFVSRGYSFFHERTGHPVVPDAAKLSAAIGDGQGINVIARSDQGK